MHVLFVRIWCTKNLEEMAVAFFNAFARKTSYRSEMIPKTGLIIIANCSFSENQRYVTSLWTTACIATYVCLFWHNLYVRKHGSCGLSLENASMDRLSPENIQAMWQATVSLVPYI